MRSMSEHPCHRRVERALAGHSSFEPSSKVVGAKRALASASRVGDASPQGKDRFRSPGTLIESLRGPCGLAATYFNVGYVQSEVRISRLLVQTTLVGNCDHGGNVRSVLDGPHHPCFGQVGRSEAAGLELGHAEAGAAGSPRPTTVLPRAGTIRNTLPWPPSS